MLIGIFTGAVVGLVIGFFGAGSAVVGLPLILLFSNLGGHMALGTNILGVSMIALFIFLYRAYKGDILFLEAAVFTVPGVAGNYFGIHIGLIFPGHKLLFLLGFVLFVIAGWMFYLGSRKKNDSAGNAGSSGSSKSKERKRIIFVGITALVIGLTAGFFAISGGFMIVPALILVGKLDIIEAAGTAIIPIVAFTSLAGVEYWLAGSVDFTITYAMVMPGIFFGILGIWLAKNLPKPLMQKMFAGFLVLIGCYMILR